MLNSQPLHFDPRLCNSIFVHSAFIFRRSHDLSSSLNSWLYASFAIVGMQAGRESYCSYPSCIDGGVILLKSTLMPWPRTQAFRSRFFYSFGEKINFPPKLSFSPKLRDKIRNGKPGFEAIAAYLDCVAVVPIDVHFVWSVVTLCPPQEMLRVEMSQTVERAREEGRREVNRKVIPLGRQGMPHTTTHFEMFFLCVCVCSRGDGLDFIPKLSPCGLIDTRSKYLRLDNEAPCELRCLPVYRCPEATGQLGVLYLQYLSMYMYTVSNQKTVRGSVARQDTNVLH